MVLTNDPAKQSLCLSNKEVTISKGHPVCLRTALTRGKHVWLQAPANLVEYAPKDGICGEGGMGAMTGEMQGKLHLHSPS